MCCSLGARLGWTCRGFAAGRSRRKDVSSRPIGHQNGETFAAEVTKFGGEAATFVGQDLGDLSAAQDVVRGLAERVGALTF
jgi:hypothetical protein